MAAASSDGRRRSFEPSANCASASDRASRDLARAPHAAAAARATARSILAMKMVQVMSEAKARPIITALTRMSADMNIDHGDNSLGTMKVGFAGEFSAVVAAAAAGAAAPGGSPVSRLTAQPERWQRVPAAAARLGLARVWAGAVWTWTGAVWHNFSLVHDDIEDGDIERRHRATLWALHGVPQAINTGDLIFSLSRVALHRLTDLGFTRREGPAADAPVRRDVRAAVRGPVPRHRHARRPTSRCRSSSTST